MPAFCLLFGDMVDGVGGVNSFDSLGDSALYMLYIGVVVYVVSFLQIAVFSVFAQTIAHKVKIEYFR